MNAIVAVSENWGIGKDKELLFNIPMDMAFFKEMTREATVIMGRGTLESLPGGRPLKGRRNIVLSTREGYTIEGAEVASSIDEALELVGGDQNVYVIGGGKVYEQMLPHCKTVCVTRVSADPSADCYFPNLEENPGWKLIERSQTFDHEGLKFCFSKYEQELGE